MYAVFEIQKTSESSVAVVTPIFTSANEHQAESEFHRLCSYAAISSVLRHTIMMIREDGLPYRVESYDHPEV